MNDPRTFRLGHPALRAAIGTACAAAAVAFGAALFGPVSDERALALSGVRDTGVDGAGRTAPGGVDERVAQATPLALPSRRAGEASVR